MSFRIFERFREELGLYGWSLELLRVLVWWRELVW